MKRAILALLLLAVCAGFAGAAPAKRPTTRRHHAAGKSAQSAQPAPAPTDPVKAAWSEAHALSDAGHHDRAIAVLDSALAVNPGNVDLTWLEAAVYGGSGNHKEAVARYERLLAVHPELARDVRMDLAGERLAADDPAGAVRDLDLRIAEDPTDRDARRMRAQALANANRLKESLTAYDKLQAEDPDNLDVALERARTLGWMGRHAEAIAAYRAVLARDPGREAALFGVAQNENWAGHNRRAAVLYDSLRASRSSDPEADKGLAFAQYWSGHAGRAQTALDRFVARRPNDPEAHELADKLARERSAGFTAGYGRADDSDELRVEQRTLDVRLPLPGEAALLLSARKTSLRDPGGTFDPMQYGAGFERTWGELWIARGALSYYKRDSNTEAFGLGEASLTWKPSDPVRLDAGISKDAIDTRLSTELGITARTLVAGVDWNVNDATQLHADVRHRDYSDDNHATQLAASARRRVHAERRWRAFVAARVEQLRTDQDLDHGYYDPKRYTEGGPGLELEWEPSRIWSITVDARTGWQQEQGANTKSFYNLNATAEVLLGRVATLALDAGRSNSNLSAENGFEQKRWAVSLSRSFFKP